MAFEKKAGMTGPMKIEVKSSIPAMDRNTNQQKVGKKIHEGLLAWYVTCAEPADIGGTITAYAATQPAAGEVYEGAWIEGNEWPAGSGTIYLTMYTAADKAKKDGSGGGRPGGGAPARDYAIENRQRAAHDATLFKGDKDWDLHTTFTVADAYVEYYKTGKKPDPKPKAPQA